MDAEQILLEMAQREAEAALRRNKMSLVVALCIRGELSGEQAKKLLEP